MRGKKVKLLRKWVRARIGPISNNAWRRIKREYNRVKREYNRVPRNERAARTL